MQLKSAKLLSWILHPLLMPLYGIFLIFHYNQVLSAVITAKGEIIIYAVVFMTTFFLPAVTAWIFLQKGMINSLQMETKEERKMPFLITLMYYLIGYYLLLKFSLQGIFYLILLAATASVTAAIIINMKWKISIHLIGIGGIAGVLLGMSHRFNIDLFFPIIAAFFCAGLLGTARLIMESHNQAQIYSGFLVGFLSELLIIVLW